MDQGLIRGVAGADTWLDLSRFLISPEDPILVNELAGYEEYATRVEHKWLPGAW